MRVLSVVTQLESGGAQTVAVELHREFLSRGIESDLLFLYEKDPGVFPRRDYTTILNRRPRSPVDLARIAARLRARWAAFRPTTVIAHTHFTNNLCAMMKATGTPGDLLAVHHTPFETFPKPARILDRISRRLGLYASEISVAEPVAQSLPGGATASRTVILNGQNLNRSAIDKTAARASFGLPADAFLIGNIGRLSEQKNQAFLVDLLPLLPDIHVAILGEGQLRADILARATRLGVADRLTLIGAVVHERVPDFLAALDLFAMPSLFEGMSIAMLEALAAGIPFLGTDVPTIAEVVDAGIGGAGLKLPLDPDRWRDAIIALRDDPEARAALSARERERAQDFSIARMADHYLAAADAARR